MYNEQLEKLIEMAIIDGELSEKEKQILFKKAESFGVDLDEFEMVLQAKLFDKQKSDTPPSVAPKSDRIGDVNKCPACGAIVESFSIKCSDCGTEFRNTEASQNIVKFFEKLDDLEASRVASTSTNVGKSEISVGTIIKYWLFWWVLIPLKLINYIVNKSKPAQWSTTDVRKEELIMNFPVPVSKEEIFEFLTLAQSKIISNTYMNSLSEDTKYKNSWNKIWLRKMEQIQTKASLSMKNDKRAMDDVNLIVENCKKVIALNNKMVMHISIGFGVALVILITILKFI